MNPHSDLSDLEKGMPWRTIQDEFGKYRWIDREGGVYNGTPYFIEPDISARMVFIASMMHAQLHKQILDEKPNVTCPNEAVDNDRRKEVVHHEEVPGEPKNKKNHNDKKSTFNIKAKSIPVTPKTVAASTGSVRERWLVRISCSTWPSLMPTLPSLSSSSLWENGCCHARWSLCSTRSPKCKVK